MLTVEEEQQLIDGIKNSNADAQRKLVSLYWVELNFLARRIVVDHSQANDVVQEALIKVLNNIECFEGRSSLRTWIHRIVTNEALMLIRSKQSRKEESLDHLMHEFDATGHYVHAYKDTPADLEKLCQSTQVREKVRQAIEQLPDKYRLSLLLKDIEGYSVKEVAQMMETTEQNVKVRLHRARLALRNLLESEINGESL